MANPGTRARPPHERRAPFLCPSPAHDGTRRAGRIPRAPAHHGSASRERARSRAGRRTARRSGSTPHTGSRSGSCRAARSPERRQGRGRKRVSSTHAARLRPLHSGVVHPAPVRDHRGRFPGPVGQDDVGAGLGGLDRGSGVRGAAADHEHVGGRVCSESVLVMACVHFRDGYQDLRRPVANMGGGPRRERAGEGPVHEPVPTRPSGGSRPARPGPGRTGSRWLRTSQTDRGQLPDRVEDSAEEAQRQQNDRLHGIDVVERPDEAARAHAHLRGDQEHTERAEQQDEGATALRPPVSGRAAASTPPPTTAPLTRPPLTSAALISHQRSGLANTS